MIFESLSFLCGIYLLFLKVSGNLTFPPPLSVEQEKMYFEQMKNGDMRARQKLIEHNLRLVAHIAKKYYSNENENDDLISIGTIGLIKAIDSYDYKNGTRFATYAGKCLQNEILMYFRAQKKLGCEVSLSEAVETDKDGNPLTYMDIICSDESIIDTIDLKIKTEKLNKAIDKVLTKRERQIIILRYGLGTAKAKRQREIAGMLGISRSYVSRIEKAALSKLRNYMENHV